MGARLNARMSLCPLFQGISDFDFIYQCIHPLTQQYAAGDVVAAPEGHPVGLVLQGRLRSSEGARLLPGDLFGLLSAFDRPEEYSCRAERSSSVLFLPGKALWQDCERRCTSHRSLIRNASLLLARQLSEAEQRLRFLSQYGTRTRLCAYLAWQFQVQGSPMLTLPLNRLELASYLGLSRPALSREFAALQQEGILDYYRNTVKLLQPEVFSAPQPR